MNLVTYNKRLLVQKTWQNESDSDDDFQKDLDKSETKAEAYKKLEMKYNDNSYEEHSEENSDNDSSMKQLENIMNKNTKSSDITSTNNDIFLEVYG